MASNGIQIGKVSEQTGLSIDAIRFYEKQRLLERPARSEGGFRLFTAEDVQRIQFIRRAQQLGFSLPEIRELLFLQKEREACCHVRDLLQTKLEAVCNKIRELATIEEQLAKNLSKCERKLRISGDPHNGHCPVLEEIAHRSSNDH